MKLNVGNASTGLESLEMLYIVDVDNRCHLYFILKKKKTINSNDITHFHHAALNYKKVLRSIRGFGTEIHIMKSEKEEKNSFNRITLRFIHTFAYALTSWQNLLTSHYYVGVV